jgi:hypothetical protein
MLNLKKSFWRFPIRFLLSLLLALSVILLLEFALRTTIGADTQGVYAYKGYRGKQAGEKKADEFRVAAFGGSETFGVCVQENETWPFYLEEMLKKNNKPISVVNLADTSHAIYGIWHDTRLFSNINYDLAIIYAGYNDMDPDKINKVNSRGDDLVFRIFGFRRLVPTFLQEKALLLKNPNLLGDSSQLNTTKDNPTNQSKSIAFKFGEILDSTAKLLIGGQQNVQLELQKMEVRAKKILVKKAQPYEHFLSFYEKTIEWLLTNKKKILIVSPLGLDNSIQQNLLRGLLAKYEGSNNISYLSLDKKLDLIELNDGGLSCDGIHLKPDGNRLVATEILAELLLMTP